MEILLLLMLIQMVLEESHQNLEQQFATLIWELGLVY
jgi:hypothetical protein